MKSQSKVSNESCYSRLWEPPTFWKWVAFQTTIKGSSGYYLPNSSYYYNVHRRIHWAEPMIMLWYNHQVGNWFNDTPLFVLGKKPFKIHMGLFSSLAAHRQRYLHFSILSLIVNFDSDSHACFGDIDVLACITRHWTNTFRYFLTWQR